MITLVKSVVNSWTCFKGMFLLGNFDISFIMMDREESPWFFPSRAGWTLGRESKDTQDSKNSDTFDYTSAGLARKEFLVVSQN